MPSAPVKRRAYKRWLWFIGIWVGSVLGLSLFALLIRYIMTSCYGL